MRLSDKKIITFGGDAENFAKQLQVLEEKFDVHKRCISTQIAMVMAPPAFDPIKKLHLPPQQQQQILVSGIFFCTEKKPVIEIQS